MEGRRSFGQEAGLDAALVQDEPRRDRPCPELSFLLEAAAGGLVRLEGLKMGVCLRLHPGRWPQGEGRSAVCPGGRCRVLPWGWMRRVRHPGRGRPGEAHGSGRSPAHPRLSGRRGEVVRPSVWMAFGRGRMRAGWGCGRPIVSSCLEAGRVPCGCQAVVQRRASGRRLRAKGI